MRPVGKTMILVCALMPLLLYWQGIFTEKDDTERTYFKQNGATDFKTLTANSIESGPNHELALVQELQTLKMHNALRMVNTVHIYNDQAESRNISNDAIANGQANVKMQMSAWEVEYHSQNNHL